MPATQDARQPVDARLAERYGTDRRRQRTVLVVVTAVAAALALGWLVWAATYHSSAPVRGGLESFRIVDDRTLSATIDVRLEEGATGTCLLRASARDHFVVGELNAPITRPGRQQVTLRTDRRATSVELVRCTSSIGN